MQATAAFSTGDNIAVADIREIKFTGKCRKVEFDLSLSRSLTARRLAELESNGAEFECFLTANVVKFPAVFDGTTG